MVLLITDGLDRDDPDRLAAEMERLQLSARRLIWLNPLLRWDGFAPRARGIRAILPHVDSFRACHNLASLEELAAALTRPDDPGENAADRGSRPEGGLPRRRRDHAREAALDRARCRQAGPDELTPSVRRLPEGADRAHETPCVRAHPSTWRLMLRPSSPYGRSPSRLRAGGARRQRPSRPSAIIVARPGNPCRPCLRQIPDGAPMLVLASAAVPGAAALRRGRADLPLRRELPAPPGQPGPARALPPHRALPDARLRRRRPHRLRHRRRPTGDRPARGRLPARSSRTRASPTSTCARRRNNCYQARVDRGLTPYRRPVPPSASHERRLPPGPAARYIRRKRPRGRRCRTRPRSPRPRSTGCAPARARRSPPSSRPGARRRGRAGRSWRSPARAR